MTTHTLRTDGRLLRMGHVAGVEPRQLEAGIDPDHRVTARRVESHRITALLEHLQRVGVVGVCEAVGITERHGALVGEIPDAAHAVAKLHPLSMAIET